MTPLTANVIGEVCRARLTGEGRWVNVSLSLGDLASSNQFLASAERLRYEVEGMDEAARQYTLLTWRGGVISGARYTFRTLKAPIMHVCLHELRGQLGSGDVWAVSAAASMAVARLLGHVELPLDLGGWQVEEIRAPIPAEELQPKSESKLA